MRKINLFEHLKPLLVLILASLVLLQGCFQQDETPRQRFELFVQALKAGDKDKVRDCLEAQSFQVLMEDGQKRSSTQDWMEPLSMDTRSGSPQYVNLEWVARDRIARIIFQTSDGQKDSLVLIAASNRWWIRLGSTRKTNQSPLMEYEVKTGTGTEK